MKRILLLVICAVVVLNMMAQGKYQVTTPSLNVRTAPSTNAQVAGKLSQGMLVNVENIRGDWATITFNGKTCYISTRFIVEVASPQSSYREKPQARNSKKSQPAYSSSSSTQGQSPYSPNTQQSQYAADDGGHRGIDFTVLTGYDFGMKDGDSGGFSIEAEVGKRVNKYFYWGGGTGVMVPVSNVDVISIPITTNVKGYFPMFSSKVSPFIMFRAGYILNLDDTDLSSINLQLMPGIQFSMSSKTELSLMFGYMRSFFVKGGSGANLLGFKAGINFHKVSAFRRELPASYDHCFQVGIEPGALISADFPFFGASLIGSYKWTQLLSIGVGYGIGAAFNDNEFLQHRIFARGQYRINDNLWSPFVACDLGYFINDYQYGNFYMDEKTTGIFVSPSVGMSLRPSANSYLDFRIGYEIGPTVKEEPQQIIKEKASLSMSGFTFKVNFTRTLK